MIPFFLLSFLLTTHSKRWHIDDCKLHLCKDNGEQSGVWDLGFQSAKSADRMEFVNSINTCTQWTAATTILCVDEEPGVMTMRWRVIISLANTTEAFSCFNLLQGNNVKLPYLLGDKPKEGKKKHTVTGYLWTTSYKMKSTAQPPKQRHTA